jgi:hypothetical protein
MLTFRRIYLLLWKNFLFRRRHYVVTAFEIILPTLFAILMAYIRTEVPEGQKADFPDGEVYPLVSELVRTQCVILAVFCVDY